MAIAPELRAQILRLFQAERWRVGTISRQLGVHHSTVRRVLDEAGVVNIVHALSTVRPTRADRYLPFMLETLTKFPGLTASRLHAMVCERGYAGGVDHFRHIVARHRPRPAAEAYLRLRTLPGEQAQVDWGHFGHIMVGRAKRPLMAFVMVLSYSRRIFLHFSLNARMDNFLRGHVLAFATWGGVARVLLYDNLKSAVLQRVGNAIRFNPELLAFASHHRFEPRPVAVARGNQKGRVERSIRYIRDNFWPARRFTDVDDLNSQARAWCDGHSASRRWPQDDRFTVGQAFETERASLLALPVHDYPVAERLAVQVGKTPYVRFDLNDYSVPYTAVRRVLTVLAGEKSLRIVDGQEVLASHVRSYDRDQQIEERSHIEDLVERKALASAQRGMSRLCQAAPASQQLLEGAAARGENLGSITMSLLRLVDRYGAAQVQIAILAALERGVPHPNAVRLALETQREARHAPAPVAVQLSAQARLRDGVIHAHCLDSYDQLSTTQQPQPQGDTDEPKEE